MILGQVLPLVGVLLGALAAYFATSMNERAKARRDLEREWRLRKSESYLRFLGAVKGMRLVAAQMTASLGLDEESEPIDLEGGTSKLVAADDERGSAYEYVNVYGNRPVILAARELNRAVWGLEWVARERHPDATEQLWKERERAYAKAMDNYVEAIRLDLQVPGDYARRVVEYPHAEEQRPENERSFKRRL